MKPAVVEGVEQPKVVGGVLRKGQVGVGHGAQALIGVQRRAAVDRGLELLAQLAQGLERQLRQDRFLGVEVEVDRAFAQLSAAGDGSDRGPIVTVLGKDRARRLQDVLLAPGTFELTTICCRHLHTPEGSRGPLGFRRALL